MNTHKTGKSANKDKWVVSTANFLVVKLYDIRTRCYIGGNQGKSPQVLSVLFLTTACQSTISLNV